MRKVLFLSLALILLLGITGHGTSSYFSDTETSAGNTFTAWTTVCEDACGEHYIVLVNHTWDGTNSTWTYEVTSGSSPALSHWVLGWCDCSLVVAVYEYDVNGDLIPDTVWECGQDPTTGLWGIKVENNTIEYGDGETRTVTIVLAGDYSQGRVDISMKAGQVIDICEACGPVCEACPPGSMILVSGTDTMVTEAGGTPITPQNAVLAWEPCTSYPNCDTSATEDDPSLWDNSTGNYFASTGADWIWETRLTSDPGADAAETGRVVKFERTFTIPCSPIGATLDITVDNGYTVWINGNLVGCAQVEPAWTDPCTGCCEGWEISDLTEPHVHTDNWSTIESYTIPASYLVEGPNTLVILAANEQLPDGTAESNPAGLIYWLEVEWGY